MDDENFAAAVKATGRKKLIIAGVTNDVCTVYPALSLVREGYEVQVVSLSRGNNDRWSVVWRFRDDISVV
jgi:nicotinamidase-related amidase